MVDDVFAPLDSSDGVSRQDRYMANLTSSQRRAFQQMATNRAKQNGRFAQSHRQAQQDLVGEIHAGERLTKQSLQRLIKEARHQSGVNAGELLDFTLGKTKVNQKLANGEQALTLAVLRLYAENVRRAAKNFVGGISPRQVVNQSRAIDIKRANEQIFLATPFKRKGNEIYWLTNAGPDSDANNHKVVVELLDYPSMVVGRTKLPSRKDLKEMLTHGRIKFDCDCGRHRYWYRYIASIGKFNWGAYENRYPSTRNAGLTGVACKHVLRVMHQLMSEYGYQKVLGYVKKDLQNPSHQTISQRRKASEIFADMAHQANPRHANHASKRIQQKIERELKKAVAQLPSKSEQETYQQIKGLQSKGFTLTDEMLSLIANFEKRYG